MGGEGRDRRMDGGEENEHFVINTTNDRRERILLNYGIQLCSYYFLPNPLYRINIDRQDYFNCPPREVFKKRNGNNLYSFWFSRGSSWDFGNLILFAICSSLEEVRKNTKAQDRYCSVFNDDRQRWESTDQLFPLGRAWAIRRREFSV